MVGKMNEFLIAYSIHNVQPVMNFNYFQKFFEQLKNTRYNDQESYLSSDEFGEGLIYSNFMIMKEAAKGFCTESIPSDELISLKMTLIFSLLLKNEDYLDQIRQSSAKQARFRKGSDKSDKKNTQVIKNLKRLREEVIFYI